MKKLLIIIGICAVLISMPAMSALSIPTVKETKPIERNLKAPVVPDYDGTFIGGLGRIYKDGEEWQYDVWSYIAGVYKDGNLKILYGNIYNLDEEQIGSIVMLSRSKILIGRITGMEGGKLPIVGFIIDFDEDNFIGRLMSIFGPAPHMYGQYIPNE